MHLRNLTATGFELRLNVGECAQWRAETCAARRLSPVLFENKATLQEASAPDKSFFRNTLRVSTLDRILWRESRKVLNSKDLRKFLSDVL